MAFLVGPAMFLLLATPLNLVGGVLWMADIALPLIDPRMQCLHDKVAGTVTVRRRLLEQQRSPW